MAFHAAHPTPTGTSVTAVLSSTDGRRIFFVSTTAITPEDTDDAPDIYELFNGQTHLVSIGQGGSGPPSDGDP